MEIIPNIESVALAVSQFRRDIKKRAPIPREIWDDIKTLTAKHGLSEISRVVGISGSHLYRKFGKRRKGTFVDISAAKVISRGGEGVQDVAIELRRADGSEMRFRCSGGVEIFNLFYTFLRQ